MKQRRAALLVSCIAMGVVLAIGAAAQPAQDESVTSALTGEVTAIDAKARTLTLHGANGETAVVRIDAKTTIMSGSQRIGFEGLHPGEWIAVDADRRSDQLVATDVQVVDDPSEAASPSGSASASPAGASVVVGHNKLDPALVQIRAGQTVSFRNVDEMPGGHTVVADDGSFSSPALDQGQVWTQSFDVPGVYPIHIKEHPGAQAQIVVE